MMQGEVDLVPDFIKPQCGLYAKEVMDAPKVRGQMCVTMTLDSDVTLRLGWWGPGGGGGLGLGGKGAVSTRRGPIPFTTDDGLFN